MTGTDSGAPAKASKAGRDLPAAIAVGVALGGAAIGILLFAPIWWLALLAAAIAMARYSPAVRSSC